MIFVDDIFRRDRSREFPRKIHLGVDRRRRHSRFAQHQNAAVKQTKDSDNPNRNRQQTINADNSDDAD